METNQVSGQFDSTNGKALADAIVAEAAQAPMEEERLRKQLVANLMPLRISVDDEYPQEVCLLEVDGVPFFAKGDVHAIKAKQKQGKTIAISLMISAILSGKWGKLKALKENARVLLIDTEQKGADAQLIYNRTLEQAGLPKKDIFDRFQMFRLRSLTQEEKLNAVRALVMEFKPDIVFIDGIVDLMGNFNEVDDSKLIIDEVMRLSTKEVSGIDPAIVCVLHTNKASDDHNMRGHAGTMLSQKSGNVLEVFKSNGVITVRNADSRHQEVPEWSFMFDADGKVVDADEVRAALVEEQKKTRAEVAAARIEGVKEKRKAKVAEMIRSNGGMVSRNSLIEHIRSKEHLSNATAYKLVREFVADGFILVNKSNYIVLANRSDE